VIDPGLLILNLLGKYLLKIDNEEGLLQSLLARHDLNAGSF